MSSLHTVMSVFGAYVLVAAASGTNSADCDAEWKQFLVRFPGKEDSPFRQQVFCDTLGKIKKHNSNATHLFRLGVNEFSDLTTEEFKRMLGGKALDSSEPAVKANVYRPPADFTPCPYVDWRSRMPPIKNQHQCGSCWAFAAIDVVDFEAGSSHSEQQLLDCSGQGCNGGSPLHALNYLATYGSDSEQSYPYTEEQGTCRQSSPTASVSNVRSLEGECNIAAAVASQVAAVCINAGDFFAFRHYAGPGVYDQDCGSGDAGHCIGVVGYTDDYWIVRNSWGESWGMSGYGYFKRGVNLCSIGTHGGNAVASAWATPTPTPSPTPPAHYTVRRETSCFGHMLGVNYNTFAEAEDLCNRFGTKCTGVYDHECNGAYFNACDTTPFHQATAGSCIYVGTSSPVPTAEEVVVLRTDDSAVVV